MKPQDIIFLISLISLLWLNKPKYLVFAALGCLVLSMPLFAFWIFFTAERLTWYAGGFLASFLLLTFYSRASK